MTSDGKSAIRTARPAGRRRRVSATTKGGVARRSETARPEAGGDVTLPETDVRVRSVIEAAKNAGLLGEKDSRITGRVSAELVKEAKVRTGIESDTDLIEFALASLAIDDGFVEAFRSTRATIPRDLDLEF